MPKIDLEEIQRKLDANSPLPSESRPGMPKFTAATLPKNHPLWALWSRFSEIYGHQWASQQGDEPNDTWIRGLSEITPPQFGVGLRALLDRTDTWPPNLVEFRQLCLGYDPQSWERQCHQIDTSPKLENLTAKERRCREGLEQIRKLREETGLGQ